MIAATADRLTRAVPFVPPDVAAVFRPDLVERLAGRLADFAADGVVERPAPHFAEETTPSVGLVFGRFRPLLDADDPVAWADAIVTAGVDGLLLLLGQRRTPASLTDASAIPPTTAQLLAAADAPYWTGGTLSEAGRAWAKHAPRSGDGFWGVVSGGDREKSAAARRLVEVILAGATWWNVYGHYLHDAVFEARLPSGHGARWGRGGTPFIGFLEPFAG